MAEFLVELGGQRLVVGDDEDGPVGLVDDVGHREGLARARDPHQDLMAKARGDALGQLGDGLRLVALGGEFGLEPEGFHSECGRGMRNIRFRLFRS